MRLETSVNALGRRGKCSAIAVRGCEDGGGSDQASFVCVPVRMKQGVASAVIGFIPLEFIAAITTGGRHE